MFDSLMMLVVTSTRVWLMFVIVSGGKNPFRRAVCQSRKTTVRVRAYYCTRLVSTLPQNFAASLSLSLY